MKNTKTVPVIGITVLVLFILTNAGRGRSSSRRDPAPALPEITSATQPMTLDEIHARFRKTCEAAMPGHYIMTMDKDAAVLTVDFWTDGFNADVPNAALAYREQLGKWNANLENARDLCAQMQQLVNDHGHPELSVVIRSVNCDDLGQIFAVFERGALTYDVVADTPPGKQVPDPDSRVEPTDTASELGTYTVNSGSRHFHREDCVYASQIADYFRTTYTGDRLDLIAEGFRPCPWCEP